MRESVIYQDILEEGRQEGRQEGSEREKSLVLRQLTRRVGEIPAELRDRIYSLSLESLENLGEALLDFQGMNDLQTWLHQEDT